MLKGYPEILKLNKGGVYMKYRANEFHKKLWVPLKKWVARIVKKRNDDDPYDNPYAIF